MSRGRVTSVRALRARPVLAMLILALAVAAPLGLVRYSSAGGQRPRERSIEIIARRYGFEPAVIRVERGDRVRLRFASLDVVHGFQLEGYEIDVTVEPLRREFRARRGAGPSKAVEEIAFVADRAGKFRFRCSRTCGAMHPFMTGELFVGPNRLLQAASAAALGLLLGGLSWAWLRSPREERA